MKILAINWRDPFHPEAGGAEIHLDKILSFLAKKHDVVLITTHVPGEETSYSHNGYQVERIGHPFLFNFHFFFLWQKLKRKNFDLIIDDISKIGCMTPLFIKDIAIVSIFHHVHGHTLFQVLPFMIACYVFCMERIALLAYRKTCLIVVSESTKQELLNISHFTDVIILHNGVDDVFLQPHKINKITNKICIVGRLATYKRIDLALNVFSKVLIDIPDAQLTIAGKGKEEQNLKNLTRMLGLEGSVSFLGYVSEEDKLRLLRESEMFLFTSEKEGWGITVIEAAASQTPVFAFDVEGVRDSVKQGVNGKLFKFGDIDELANEIISYLKSGAYKTQLQAKALCYAKNFNWNRITQEFEMICIDKVEVKEQNHE